MKQQIDTVSNLIDCWPTIGEFAVDIGCGYEAARKMRARGRISAHYWPAVVRAATNRGFAAIDFEWLARQLVRDDEVAL